MKYTRRDLSAILPLLAAEALSEEAAPAQTSPSLPSKIYPFDQLPVKKNGPNTSRAVLRGTIHDGCALEMHISELAPGMAPHPPHHHLHDEMVIVRQGTLDVMINGNHSNIGPGSVVFFSSGDEHGFRNVGAENAMYYVIALGKD